LTNDRSVAATLLLSNEIEKKGYCLSLGLEMVALRLAGRSDTSPTSRQASLSKQIGLDRHRIEAGHVFLNVRSFNIKMVGLGDHAPMIVSIGGGAVQRQF